MPWSHSLSLTVLESFGDGLPFPPQKLQDQIIVTWQS